MKEKEIFEQFLKLSGVAEEEVVDYRYCTKFYAGMYIEDAIIIQLKDTKNYIIFKACDLNTITEELGKAMGSGESLFMQGYRSALENVKSYGQSVEHISVK